MTETDDGVRKEMRTFIEDNFLYMHPDIELADGDDLLKLGIIDSLGFVELVEEVQSRYGIAVDDVEITEENFGSIDAITGFVRAEGDPAMSARTIGEDLRPLGRRRAGQAGGDRPRGRALLRRARSRRRPARRRASHDIGVQRGDRVATLLPNALEAVIAIYGVLRAGAAISPLNPTVKARQARLRARRRRRAGR